MPARRRRITRYTECSNTTAGWSDSVDDNFDGGWQGYHYIYPIAQCSGSGWVSVQMTGYAYGTPWGYAIIGPVLTWQWVTK